MREGDERYQSPVLGLGTVLTSGGNELGTVRKIHGEKKFDRYGNTRINPVVTVELVTGTMVELDGSAIYP